MSLANQQRTFLAYEDCGDVAPDVKNNVLVENLTGNIELVDGANVRVGIGSGNSVLFATSPGGGSGFPCSEIAGYAAEESVVGLPLSGGNACSEVLTSFGGSTGTSVTIVAGKGLSVASGDTGLVVSGDPTEGDACGG